MTARNNASHQKSVEPNAMQNEAGVQSQKTAAIRLLNDRLRQLGMGGEVILTGGILAFGQAFAKRTLSEVQKFQAFTEDNDPYGEHDCASMIVDETAIIWKIDYFDTNMQFHSPDAADPTVTRRVLTIMAAHEY